MFYYVSLPFLDYYLSCPFLSLIFWFIFKFHSLKTSLYLYSIPLGSFLASNYHLGTNAKAIILLNIIVLAPTLYSPLLWQSATNPNSVHSSQISSLIDFHCYSYHFYDALYFYWCRITIHNSGIHYAILYMNIVYFDQSRSPLHSLPFLPPSPIHLLSTPLISLLLLLICVLYSLW